MAIYLIDRKTPRSAISGLRVTLSYPVLKHLLQKRSKRGGENTTTVGAIESEIAHGARRTDREPSRCNT
jgi:hypothetical protein